VGGEEGGGYFRKRELKSLQLLTFWEEETGSAESHVVTTGQSLNCYANGYLLLATPELGRS
jgi:hypothetical protein